MARSLQAQSLLRSPVRMNCMVTLDAADGMIDVSILSLLSQSLIERGCTSLTRTQ